MMFRRNRLDYLQKDIDNHIGGIIQLRRDQDKQMQRTILAKGDSKQQKELVVLDQINDNIMTAHKALGHMLERYAKQLERKGKKGK